MLIDGFSHRRLCRTLPVVQILGRLKSEGPSPPFCMRRGATELPMGGAVPAEPAPSPTPPEPGSSAEGQDQKRGKGPRPPLGESSVQGKRIFPSFLHALSSPSQTKGLQENFSSRPRGLRGGGGGGDRPSFPAGLSELQHRRAHLAHCRSGAQRGSLGVYSGSQEVFSLSREKQCLACGP